MLTPSDIRNRMLKTTMGGYNKKDTDDFLDSVYQSFEILYKENKDFKVEGKYVCAKSKISERKISSAAEGYSSINGCE